MNIRHTEHHNFDHKSDGIPQGGNGRKMRCHFTGRDWCGVVADAERVDIYHMPSPRGLDTTALKAAGWVLVFD